MNNLNDFIIEDGVLTQYKGNDKLYLPVEDISKLYKYVSKEGMKPTINKLNSLSLFYQLVSLILGKTGKGGNMLKLVIKIKEEAENKLQIGIKQLTEKEFNSSTLNEKIAASELKTAIDFVIKNLKNKEEK